MTQRCRAAIIGATGAVGRKLIECIEKREFPVSEVALFASPGSEGKVLHVSGKPCRLAALSRDRVSGFDLAFLAAGAAVAREFAPLFAAAGAAVVDTSGAWSLEPGIPLGVPEINPRDIRGHGGIVASPTAPTVPLALILHPLHRAARVRRVSVSTYQPVSGEGLRAMMDFEEALLSDASDTAGRTRPSTLDAVPLRPVSRGGPPARHAPGEIRLGEEIRKILEDPAIGVAATCVRVPVRQGMGESIAVETERAIGLSEALDLLGKAPGLRLCDGPGNDPTPAAAAGKPEVQVGHVREDPSMPGGLLLWAACDNLLKGSALNAVQIAELIMSGDREAAGPKPG